MTETLTIGKSEYEVRVEEVNLENLSYYAENPRVYSALNVSEGMPDQIEIESIMSNLEHVKQLRLSIEANGGLIDPLIVRDGDLVVLEGNCRLASYRLLASKDKIKWGKVKCKILPSNISDSAIFTLLGQYHIVGRKDWLPFEQAGYLHRRIKKTDISVNTLAYELGIPLNSAQTYIKVYSFMHNHEDLSPNHWSYYVEYLKNNAIKKYRETNSDLDKTIVEQIKTDKIAQATDIRDKLGGIAKVKGKVANKLMKQIIENKLNIYQAFEKIKDTGKTGNIYQYLNRFRTRINDVDFDDKIKREWNHEIEFEVRKIKHKIDKLLKLKDNKIKY